MDDRSTQIRDQILVMRFWRVYLFVMYGLHYLLGIGAVLLSVTVASKPFPAQADPVVNGYFAYALALVTGINAFVSPERVGERYQKGYRVLSVAITRFLSDVTTPLQDVLDAYEKGEDFIHQKRTTE